MNHEQSFLQAIREAPDDDAPRLIYADWLEEQGGAARAARANFIRIQCRLDELPEDDPARDPLEDEAADLLAAYEAEWTQPLRGIAEDWRFSRGFIEHIRIRGDDLLTQAESLFDFTPLRNIHLLYGFRVISHLAACPQLQWVETLDFSCRPSNHTLNDRLLQQLLTSPYLGRLTALILNCNSISTPGVQALIHSPVFTRLTQLDLNGDRGIGDRVVELLAQAPGAESLRRLSLAQTNVTIHSLPQLFQSSRLTGLTDLNLAGVHFARLQGDFLLARLSHSCLLAQLRSLDVSETAHPDSWQSLLTSPKAARLQKLYLRGGIGFESANIQPLTNSPYLASLTTLDLCNNNLGDGGVQALAASPYLASLRSLDVSCNVIRDKGVKALAESPHLARLTLLNLTRNSIGGPGLKALAESANLANLRTLNLASNFIGADSVRALAESVHLRRLTCLDLGDAFLEEDSARILAASENLMRMTTLLLKKNLLGDGGAKALAQSPHLTRLATLDLNDNRIGKAAAEALAAAKWGRMRNLDLRGNGFTVTQEVLLRNRFGNAVQL